VIKGDWRSGVAADQIGARLAEDKGHAIKAVCVVHNETSTGVASDIAGGPPRHRRRGPPGAADGRHDLVAGSIDFRHDEWGVDVTMGGLAEGADAAAGAVVQRRLAQGARGREEARLPRSYWDWEEMIAANATGYFPYTPATNLLQGLKVALRMLLDEGLDVFARHNRAAEATRAAVRHWGFETQCPPNPSTARR
jgi:alanine-glyoxylate transaminase / serine-glyoxylate transaminase / serine-pyruvate transaminase